MLDINLFRETPDLIRQALTRRRMDPAIVDMMKRELSDIRFSQSETDRRTQDTLETVNSTLGHVVDRLAMIEGDLRAVRSAPVPVPAPVAPPAAAAKPVAKADGKPTAKAAGKSGAASAARPTNRRSAP